jgi:integrase/recombinase XerD
VDRKTKALSPRRLDRQRAWAMVKRRAQQAGIETPGICNHTFRGTGITAYLENPQAKLEHAQQMAAHSDPKTTRLYDRRSDEVSMDEVERIGIWF